MDSMFENVNEMLDFIKKNDIKAICYKLIDIQGNLKTVTIPALDLKIDEFEDGYGFDGSNYGYAKVENSDMLFKGNCKTSSIDQFSKFKTISMYADVFTLDEKGDAPFAQYPHTILQKAVSLFREKDIADSIWFLPELEFYVFDKVSFNNTPEESHLLMESSSGNLLTGENLTGYKSENGYHCSQPLDTLNDYRTELMLLAENQGIDVKYHHHEVGAAGQIELELHGGDVSTHALNVIELKYMAKNLALQYGKTATFMPKPLRDHPGSGLHVHIKLLKDNKNLFYGTDDKYYGLSPLALKFLGGILKHGDSLLAFTNPSINSYKRLVKGYEAPIAKIFGKANRTSAIRIPAYAQSEVDKRIEFRPQDASCNPFLSFAAILMAGLDGILSDVDPEKEGFGPFSKNSYQSESEFKSLPNSLDKAINALKKDRDYLELGNIFPTMLIDNWIKQKEREIDEYNRQVTPWEFQKYYSF